MGRARGANAVMAAAFESAYGTPPGSGYFFLPFVTSNLGEQQDLVANDVLGFGREPQRPSKDVINNTGDVVIPWDLRNLGYWLKLMFGAPTTTQGIAATGSYTFSAQPTANATLTVNGQSITFVSGAPTANQVKIGATLADTVANAIVALNASAVAGVAAATYSGTLAGNVINITHDTIGTAGNSFTTVAGSSPASNATPAGATLSGGAANGPYNHVFSSGAANLPSMSIEVGNPEVPSYGMNYGLAGNTLSVPLARGGNLNATVNCIAQGELPATSTSSAGSPTTAVFQRLANASGQIFRDGVPLSEIVSGNWVFSNGLDPVEVIRADGRIAGVDSGVMSVTSDITTRFSNSTLLDLAVNGTAIELRHNWSIDSTKNLTLITHQVDLPRPKRAITGPGGISVPFNFLASGNAAGKFVTAVLVNDISSY